MCGYSPESRKVELDGISKLKKFYGENAEVNDLAKFCVYDFEIQYSDGRKAIGEISALKETDFREMWNAIGKRQKHQHIQLENGWGYWSLILQKSININLLEKLAPTWIAEMLDSGTDELIIYEGWPDTDLALKMRKHGVSRIRRISDACDQVWFKYGGGGVEAENLIPLRDTIQLLIQENETVRSNCEKLYKFAADEKHVYLRLGELVSNLQTSPLYKHLEPFEIPELKYPVEISHIWLDSGTHLKRNILWQREKEPLYF